MPVQAMQECKTEPEDSAPTREPEEEVPLPTPATPSPTLRQDSLAQPSDPSEPDASLEATQVDAEEPVGPVEPAGSHEAGSHGQAKETDDDKDGDEDDDDEEPYKVVSLPPKPLSQDAVYHRVRRIMQPRADGSFLVSKEFRDQYKDKVNGRPKLDAMFEKAGYNPEPLWKLSF